MILNKLEQLSIVKKFALVVALFLAADAAIAYFVILGGLDEIKKIRNDIIAQKLEMETRTAHEANYEKLSEKLAVIEPGLHEFDRVFISRNQELEFITTLEGIAGRNGVAQKINFNVSPTRKDAGIEKQTLDINAQGYYHGLLAYINDLETLNYYVNIRSLDFSSSMRQASADNQGAPVTVNLKITADTYWR